MHSFLGQHLQKARWSLANIAFLAFALFSALPLAAEQKATAEACHSWPADTHVWTLRDNWRILPVDLPNAKWLPARIADSWTLLTPELSKYQGRGIYSFCFLDNANIKGDLGLWLPAFFGPYILSVNGQALAQASGNPTKTHYVTLPGALRKNENVLSIETKAWSGFGGARHPIQLGPKQAITDYFHQYTVRVAALVGTALFLALMTVLTAVRSSHGQKHSWYYAILNAAIAIHISTMPNAFALLAVDSPYTDVLLGYCGGFLITPALLNFLFSFFGLKKRWFDYIIEYYYYSLVIFAVGELTLTQKVYMTNTYLLDPFYLSTLLCEFYLLALVGRCIWQKRPYARMILAGLFVKDIFMAIVFGYLFALVIVDYPLAEGYVIFSLILGATIAWRYMNERIKIESKAQGLLATTAIQDRFVQGIATKLAAPLDELLDYTSALQAECRTAKERLAYNARLVHDASLRLRKLVNDLSNADALKKGTLKLLLGPVDIHRSVSRALSILTGSTHFRLTKKQLKVVNNANNILALADSDRLEQVLINVIGNAIKFTPRGTVEITCKMRPGGNFVDIYIKDTGIGIPADKIESIFLPFHQGDSSATRAYGGTGIGLSLAKQLLELHGGEISVTSALGKGSTFTISLPLFQESSTQEGLSSIMPELGPLLEVGSPKPPEGAGA